MLLIWSYSIKVCLYLCVKVQTFFPNYINFSCLFPKMSQVLGIWLPIMTYRLTSQWTLDQHLNRHLNWDLNCYSSQVLFCKQNDWASINTTESIDAQLTTNQMSIECQVNQELINAQDPKVLGHSNNLCFDDENLSQSLKRLSVCQKTCRGWGEGRY